MVSLLRYNTFGIDQSCRNLYEPTSEEELIALLPRLRREPLLVIGEGSNLLLTRDFEGNVLHPCIKGRQIKDTPQALLRCGAGENWDDTVAFSITNGLYDMENLSLIPGEVGASAVQNIGAYGMEAKDIIYEVEAIEISSGKKFVITNADCHYAYRYSRFKAEWKGKFVITHVTYKLSRHFTPRLDYGNLRTILLQHGITQPSAQDIRDAVIEIRKAKLPDPKVVGNAGSFFMNPVVDKRKYEELKALYPDMPHYQASAPVRPLTVHQDRYPEDTEWVKIPAGWMIDQCGWKGKTLGRARVHPMQALVLVNNGGATGADIVALCEAIRHDVAHKFGVDIQPEVNII